MKSSDFFAEFANLKDELSSAPDEPTIAGDYSIHWDKSGESKHVMECMHSASVVQRLNEITHTSSTE